MSETIGLIVFIYIMLNVLALFGFMLSDYGDNVEGFRVKDVILGILFLLTTVTIVILFCTYHLVIKIAEWYSKSKKTKSLVGKMHRVLNKRVI